MSELRLATRRSPLALTQAEFVQRQLVEHGVTSVLVPLETRGDRQVDVSLDQLGAQGVFAVEVQRAVMEGDADVAIHSAKDLPSSTPEGLTLTCVPQRLDAADVLIGRSLAGLGPGATVATGSPRRRALLLERRPDLRIVGLRGNMATRFAAANQSGIDAVVAAAAALERLGENALVAERLDTEWFIPQVGQGALALEVRQDDDATIAALASLNQRDAMTALMAERAFLNELGAGCLVPCGAYATVSGSAITVRGVMLSVDGSRSVRGDAEGDDPLALGRGLAHQLRDEQGGGALAGWQQTP
ncbi:MAG TPA: hydroxymethylbilane synthase [Acidimicrobiales bacterium]|nr:hydroxymethylbilane synthase [Acidimicrobiales bacterium]